MAHGFHCSLAATTHRNSSGAFCVLLQLFEEYVLVGVEFNIGPTTAISMVFTQQFLGIWMKRSQHSRRMWQIHQQGDCIGVPLWPALHVRPCQVLRDGA
jgi:hypothetical protein